MKTIVLCGRGQCCPKLRVPLAKADGSWGDKQKFTIIDDDGKKVKLTKEQLDLLATEIRKL